MMRRSGASPAVKRRKFSAVMLRRAASGHIAATQLSKLAAAWRIAAAVIRGWPEAPSSPLQGSGPVVEGVAGGCTDASCFGLEKMLLNKSESPPPEDWACAEGAKPKAVVRTASRVAVASVIGFVHWVMLHPLP